MPNHVVNSVSIKGNKEEIIQLEDYVRTRKGTGPKEVFPFDFSSIVPPPNNLYTGSLSLKKEKELAAEGIPDWYNWNRKNWGTKWNAYSIAGPSEKGSGDYRFETAWSTPYPVFVALSREFPKLEITVEYADEDVGSNCGSYTLKNGEEITTYLPKGKEASEFAAQLLYGMSYEKLKAQWEIEE